MWKVRQSPRELKERKYCTVIDASTEDVACGEVAVDDAARLQSELEMSGNVRRQRNAHWQRSDSRSIRAASGRALAMKAVGIEAQHKAAK